MKDERIEQAVVEVLKRLLPALGVNGSRGKLIVVFTGATVGSVEAITELRQLILRGFELQLVFSETAEHIYGQWVRDGLAGFPCWDQLPPVTWLRALRETRAVVVPLLSVSSLSKLALLIADSQTGNFMLHGLFTGKPVIVARNGFEPNTKGRAELGFNHGWPELTRVIEERARTVASYGCVLVDITQLSVTVAAALADEAEPEPAVATRQVTTSRTLIAHPGGLVTAGDVIAAHRQGADLHCSPRALVTPLARELAAQHGVCIVRDESC
ncbi:MAG: hypothetical protein CXZ00_14085 [Acidobacteria bacterium]|nr:MAG: hypothetical protein CXZ00_14085 [Acidobacteriota bacterium]